MMNKNEIVVSVCMITYNHEAYIRQAIESVLSQKTGYEFELVIGEDCSTDTTRAICEEYAGTQIRISLLPSVNNLGLMPNFIRTMQACRGRYIAFCEGDDYWTDPLKLQKQVEFLESNSSYAGCAHQSMVLVDNNESRLFRQQVPTEIAVTDLIGLRLFHTASVVFRSSVLELIYKAPPVISGDRLVNFCIAFSGKYRFFDDCMCVYRLHDAGMSSVATIDQMKLDLNSVPYLKKINPAFPQYHYLSYVYLTIGLCKSGSLYQRMYYRFLSFLFSFSYFPANLKELFKQFTGKFRKLFNM